MDPALWHSRLPAECKVAVADGDYGFGVTTATGEYWNHNVHYQRVILAAVPTGCQAAIDVGCGDGMLACKLATRCSAVTGIDKDERIIEAARARGQATPAVSFVQGRLRARRHQ